ncbi:hypothetical protein [Paenibacillus harenae]|uniref:hypothetical protein n=1 Tax=Paenibacillus harenae TaxID=306543 RepID=UPI002793554D|nr:hypothetical protein [Paenibacillus harenae]MDQ0062201.1 putative lipoprotein [Paenibacillus harenae]
MATMLDVRKGELIDAPYIQTADVILAQSWRSKDSHTMLSGILDGMAEIYEGIGQLRE